MKRICTLVAIFLFGAALWSCSYDDDDLWKAVDGLDSRVEALDAAVKKANTDIIALQKLVEALQKNISIKTVEYTDNGYKISFTDGSVISIANGKDGVDAPVVGVKKDDDGVYYWTLGGEFIEVDGVKLAPQGQDGTSPQLRINPTSKEWEMSTDKGATWTSLGVKAEGKDGSSIFTSVDTTTKPGMAIFTLTSGEKIEVPLQGELTIAVSAKSSAFVFGEKQTFTITAKGVERITYTKPDGWRVAVSGSTLTVTAPVEANVYAETEGTITLIGMAGNYSAVTDLEVRALSTMNTQTVTFEGADWSQWVACNYHPDAFSTTQMGSPDDYAWIDATTQLTTGRPEGFMSGWGYPWFVCSYNSNSLDQSKYGFYLYDLYVYNPNGPEDSTTGGGNNGSDNFITTFGYLDLVFPYGDGRPILKFADGNARTVKSIYVTSTCYFYSVAMDGNGLSPALTEDVTYYATGYDADDNELGTVTMTFATPEHVTNSWTEWDLSGLGEIVSLKINQDGGADNGYGYSLPAYLAVDDITIAW